MQDPYLKFYFGESAKQKRKEENKSNPRIVRVLEEESYEGRNYSTHRSTRKRKRFIIKTNSAPQLRRDYDESNI